MLLGTPFGRLPMFPQRRDFHVGLLNATRLGTEVEKGGLLLEKFKSTAICLCLLAGDTATD